MDTLTRYLSRPTAKPYRTRDLEADGKPFLNADGHVDFAEGDIENPKNWSKRRRWYITVVCVLLVVNATFASSSPSACVEGIAAELNVSVEAAGLVTTLFLLGYCAGPLFFAPLSEFYGRRWIFIFSFGGYLVFNFMCGWAPNFACLIVGRFISGTFASSSLSNAPGVLADLWTAHDRGNAMALFSMMTFAGPALGPVISGFLELKENWRWSFYVLLWLGGITLIPLFTIPETLGSTVLVHKARRIRAQRIPGYEDVLAPIEASDRRLKSVFAIALVRPWKLLIDPISLLCAVYMSVVYTLVYMLFTIYPIVFQQKRGWNAGVGELPLIGVVIGGVFGACFIFWNTNQNRKKAETGYKGTPEDRMIVAMIGGVLFPIAMFWLAWTGEFNSIHWFVPTLAGVFLAASILLIFVAYLNYLVDTYLMYAASALAANTVARSACGASAPLFTQYMFDALGVGGGGSLIAGMGVLLAIIPFAFYRYGGAIRQRSAWAPTPQKQPAGAEAKDGEDKDSSDRDASEKDSVEEGPSTPQLEPIRTERGDAGAARQRAKAEEEEEEKEEREELENAF